MAATAATATDVASAHWIEDAAIDRSASLGSLLTMAVATNAVRMLRSLRATPA